MLSFSATILAVGFAQATPTALPVHLEPLWQVGSAEDTLVVLSRLFPPQVTAGPNSQLFVIESDRGRVLVIGPSGALRRAIGRQGDGPGELRIPITVGVTSKGTVTVYDAAKRALVRYDVTGKPLAPIAVPSLGVIQQLAALDETTFLVSAVTSDSTELIRIDGRTQTRLAAIPQPVRHPVNAQRCGILGHEQAPFFSARLLWTRTPAGIGVNTDGSPTVQILASELPTTFRAPTPQQRATAAAVRDFYGDSVPIWLASRSRPCNLSVAVLLRDAGAAPFVPVYERLTTLDGRIWALRLTPRATAHLADIYDPQRGYVGTITLGSAVPVAMLPGNRLISLETDEDGTPILQAYRVSGL